MRFPRPRGAWKIIAGSDYPFPNVHVPNVHADHPLDLALERMSESHIDILPVVNRAYIHTLEGTAPLGTCWILTAWTPAGQLRQAG